MKKIVHIATDEKFIDEASWMFEQVYPEDNVFYIFKENINDPFKFVKKKPNTIAQSISIASIKKLALSIDKNNLVVLHGLFYHTSVLVNNLKDNVKIIWLLFGIEYHNNPLLKKESLLYGNNTYKYLYSPYPFKHINAFVKSIFRNLYYKFFEGTNSPYVEMINAAKKADLLGVVYEEEFNEIKSSIKLDKLQHLNFFYCPIERMINDNSSFVIGYDILLGNSSSLTCNHLDAMQTLSQIEMKKGKIICPLSYGEKKYAKFISDKGKQLFNDKFVPLIEFMPLKKYNDYLRNCGFVIMNNYRQQALGNIMTMLWMGAKVFLSKRNTTYTYLKRINIHVFSIEEDIFKKNAFELLTQEQRNHNRSILISEIGQEKTLNTLKSNIDLFIK